MMRKHIKIVSLALVLAMMITVCACSAKNTGSGVKHNDLPSKPEDPVGKMTEPVVTTSPDPSGTLPTETEPFDPDNGGYIEMSLSDLIYVSELCIGMPTGAATELLTAVYGISDYTTSDSNLDPSNNPMERFLRDLDKDLIVEGIAFKSIGIHSNSDGLVYDVDYTMRETALFASNEELASKEAYDTLYPVFCELYGDPDDDYMATWTSFDESGMDGWRYAGDCWLSIFWGKSCQSVKGNDQLVIGIECDDPSSRVTGGIPGNVISATINDVYGVMYGLVGLDLDTAVSRAQSFFGVSLGTPDVTLGEGSDTNGYTYNLGADIDGIHFNEFELDTNRDGVVFYVSFINNLETESVAHDYCMAFKDKLTLVLGDPSMEFPLESQDDVIEFYEYEVEDGDLIEVGAYYNGAGYNSLWFSYSDDSLR